ncbi:MAG TPA: gliding motility-associated C-terminal domain-containing protein, partial [Bacteroidales bacterium]|nr:gliding motility-associated C-terminal domain-containing protein [Bacteroidales bacterium]
DISGLAPGTYYVTVTDAYGCIRYTSATILQSSALLAVSASSVVPVSCKGSGDGSIDVTVSGGTAPFSYHWSGPGSFSSSSEDISGLAPGTYSLTVTDAYNCVKTLSENILESSALLAVSATSVVPVSCKGSGDGSIDVTVSGGTAPFSYHWAGPNAFSSISEDISGLAPGTYSLTVTDAYNCAKTLEANILESSALLAVSITSTTPVTCSGGGDGSINISVSGGTLPYVFVWSGPASYSASTEDISGLAPGTYYVTVTDAYKCAKTASAKVEQSPGMLTLSISTITPVSCTGSHDGSIDLSVSNGTLPYNYSWSGPGSYTASSEDISGLAPGTYYVTVTDAYKCAKTASAKVEQSPGMLTLSISTITPVSCTGSHDGSIDLSVSNGTLPYNYSWSGPGSYTASSEDISGLAPGTYYVTVTDAYGCIRYTSATILQSSALLAVSASSVVPVSCKGSGDGSIDVTVSGGTAPFSYHWSGPGSFSSSSEDISGLAPGAYNLTVTDAYNCSKTLEVEILEPELLTIQAEGSSQVSCYNTNDGVITVTANGGTGAYSFSLNGGPIQSSNVFNGLPSGTYSITVFDINNCSATTEALLNIINPPLLVISAVGSSQVSCHNSNDGVITATANGGTGAYSYSLNGGPNQSSNVFSNLPADTYIVTVYDINNCSASTPEIIINNPAILTLTAIASPQVSCYNASDGVITATATGGTGAYSYSLNGGAIQSSNVFSGLPAGTYIVTVYDIKGCSATAPQITIANPEGLKVMAKASFQVSCYNASDGEISATASGGTGAYKYSLNNGPAQLSNVFKGLSSGKYIVSVFDANNCSAATPEMIINNPPLLTAEAMISSQISCHDVNDGIITVTAMGGTGTFSYSLNGGPAQTSNVFSGLSEGTYNITVNDIYNCSAITEFPIVITNPSPITIVTTNSPQVSCHDASDGFITATVSGGTGSYSYSINGGPLQVSNEFTDLTSGTYVLTVFDANNCSAVSPSIVINNPAVLTIDASITSPVLCHDQSNGVINATAEGGTGIYSYSINEGPIQSSSVFSGLSSGTYVISVFDANNCKATSPEITLLNPQPLSASVAITSEVSCYNGSDGAILVSSSGGTAPYSYSLNGELPQESDVFSDLPAGNYVLTVYDNMGCSVEVQFELSQPDQIKIELVSVVDADCTGNLNGAIEISASGGESPYTYSWSNGSLTPMIEGLSAGNYTVTVTDNKGCQNEYTKQVNPGPVEEQLGFSNAFTPDGDGINDLWAIKNIELYPDNSLVVVNRWGNEIYSIKGYQGNWDGSQLTEGTYFYILKVEMCNVQRTFNGYITILR